ncbi:MAG TPA: MFS transporter [Thermoanaerobaculia bacterium]
MARQVASHGMRMYWIVWAGNFISGIGTSLGSFSLVVWIYDQTKSASQFSTMMTLAAVTGLICMPIGGSIADRFDRRKILIAGNLASAVITLLMVSAFYTGQMKVWYSYIIAVVMNAIGTLTFPSFLSSIRLLVPRGQLVRVAGLTQTAHALTGMAMPPLAGFLIGRIHYHGVIAIDLVTFLFASLTLFLVRIPRPAALTADVSEQRSVLGDMVFAWQYIRTRAGLFSLLSLFALTNFVGGMINVVLGPLILSFASPTELGVVNAASTGGMLLGAFIISLWGGPKRRVQGILWGFLAQACLLFLAGLEPSVPLLTFAMFLAMFVSPFILSCNQAIWQLKVDPAAQGRVLAARGTIGMAAAPLAFATAGPLSDYVFRPLLVEGGALADSVGRVIGVGPGRGTALMLMVIGVLLIVAILAAFANPRLRNVETDLPDIGRQQQPDEPGGAPAAPQEGQAAAAG